MTEREKLQTELGTFIWWACAIGIAVPILGAAASDYWFKTVHGELPAAVGAAEVGEALDVDHTPREADQNRSQSGDPLGVHSIGSAFGDLVYLLFLTTLCVALGGPLYILHLRLKKPNVDATSADDPIRIERRWLYGVGASTAALMGSIVALTGGPLKSPFVFYLLYLPSVTAVCFTPAVKKKTTSFWKTWLEAPGTLIVAVVCGLFLVVGVLWQRVPPAFTAYHGSPMHKIWYLLMVGIQLFSIVWMEHKGRTRESLKGKSSKPKATRKK